MKKKLFQKKLFLHVNHKILLAFFVAVLIIYSVGLFLNIRLQGEVKKSFINAIKFKSNYILVELNSRLKHIDSLITYTITRYNVRKIVLFNQPNAISNMFEEMRSVRQILSSITSSSNLVNDAAIFLPELGFKISAYNYKVELEEEDYGLLSYISSSDELDKFVIWENNIYMVSTIYSPNDKINDYPASLIIELSKPAFYQYAAVTSPTDDTEFMIVANGRYIIDDSSLEESYKNLTVSELMDSTQPPKENSEYEEVTIDGSKYFSLNEQMDKYNINIVSVSDPNAITRDISQPQTWSFLFTLIAGLAFISFLLIINHLVSRPIKKINETIELLEHDHILEFSYDKNELTSLYQALNNLIGRLKGAIEQVYNNKLIAHQAEMKYLQAQINPHFLYNSFFHLYRMSKMEDLDGVAEMSNKLGRYYQYITRSAAAMVPFEMEYMNAKDYTDIQTIRFGNRITVCFSEISEEHKKIKVPKFVLQPILENAYNHGLDGVVSGGIIKVDIESDNDYLAVTVQDNGGAVSDSKIGDITSYLNNEEFGAEITGLKNTKIRLSSYGGKIKVDSNSDGGLKVMLFIPLKNPKKE